VYREYGGDGTSESLERESLHVMDDKQRVALVETKTIDNQSLIPTPQPLIRYQFGNHLGSASLELDDSGQIISYEEYYPYGSTSYQAGRSAAEVSLKRYRYTGMERDEETGFTYHGARYYAPWLGRWVSCDQAGIVDGLNLYSYVVNNPIRLIDPNGLQSEDVESTGDWLESFAVGGSLVAIKNEIRKDLPNSQNSVEEEDSAAHLRVKNMSFEDASLQGGGAGVLFWGLNKLRNEKSTFPPDGSVIAAQFAADLAIKAVEGPLLSAHEAGVEAAKAKIVAEKGDLAGAYGHMKNAEAHADLAFAEAYLATNPWGRLEARSWTSSGVIEGGELPNPVILEEVPTTRTAGSTKLLGRTRDRMLNVAEDKGLRTTIDNYYRADSMIGAGSTGDVLIAEKETGILITKAGHLQKALVGRSYLQDLVRSGTLNASDLTIAREILEDLQKAISSEGRYSFAQKGIPSSRTFFLPP